MTSAQAAPAAIITSPVRKLEVFVDENTSPPTLHVSLPYPDLDRNVWVLRQALKQLQGTITAKVKV